MVFGGTLHQFTGKVAFVADVTFALAALHAVKRRLRDVHVIALNQLLHVAEEKGKQKRANVRTVNVRIGHENDFVVAQLAGVEIILANARAKRRDDRADFFVAEHLVVAGLLDVKNLAFEGKDGLIFAVAALLRGSAGPLALDDEQFAMRRIALLAVGKLAGQAAGIHGGLATREFGSLGSRFT